MHCTLSDTDTDTHPVSPVGRTLVINEQRRQIPTDSSPPSSACTHSVRANTPLYSPHTTAHPSGILLIAPSLPHPNTFLHRHCFCIVHHLAHSLHLHHRLSDRPHRRAQGPPRSPAPLESQVPPTGRNPRHRAAVIDPPSLSLSLPSRPALVPLVFVTYTARALSHSYSSLPYHLAPPHTHDACFGTSTLHYSSAQPTPAVHFAKRNRNHNPPPPP